MATAYYGPGPEDILLQDIQKCLNEWGDDPTYAQPAQKLREVGRELDALQMAPGRFAAIRAANQSGQEPSAQSDKDY